MLLSKLEAHGFKSFADPVEVHFGPGITAVVGPNGSGKSNITDAIRWALGEQSLKTLRGTKSEDIIFAGTSTRRALGAAEVSLTFDNSDGSLPLDFEEVVITRRLYRSGDSEYFINRSNCRLKDIFELLADSGIGRESMCVVGQNKIDEILNTKAEDRRVYFEEAAGISKYKQRKKESLRKLEDTKQNLLRLSDLTQEIEQRLVPLAESAEKTTRYRQLSQELRQSEVGYFVQRLEKAELNGQNLRLDYDLRREQELRAASALSLLEISREKTSDFLAQQEEALQLQRAKLRTVEDKVRDREAQCSVLRERMKQNQTNQERFQTEEVNYQLRYEQLVTQQQNWQQQNEQLLEAKEQLKTKLSQSETEFQQCSVSIHELKEKVESGKDQLFDAMQQLTHLHNDQRQNEKELQRLILQQEKSQIQWAEAEQNLQAVQQKARDMVEQRKAHTGDLEKTVLAQTKLVEQVQDLREQFQRKTLSEKALQKSVHELSARQRVLQHLQQDYEGFGRAIRSLLKSQAEWRQGILGPVAELIHVAKPYVVAIETALGGAMQHLVTADAETAQLAIQFLKSQKLGRATFLPLTTVQPFATRDIERAARNDSLCIGFASELVQFDVQLAKVVQQLLGRCLVCRNLEAALALAKKNRYQLKIVTLEGEVLYPGGSLAGGSSQNRRESGFLGRQAELDELGKTLIENNRALNQCVLEIQELEQEVKACESRLGAEQEQQRQIESAVNRLNFMQEQLQTELRRLEMAKANAQHERQKAAKNRDQLQQQGIELTAEVEKQQLYCENLKRQVATWQADFTKRETIQQELNAALTGLQIESSQLAERLRQVEQENHRLDQEIAQASEQLERLRQGKQELNQEWNQAEADFNRLSLEVSQCQLDIQDLEQGKKRLEQDKVQKISEVQILDKQIKEQRSKVQGLQSALHDLELALTRFDSEVTYCQEQLMNQFELTPAEAAAFRSEQTESVLKEQIRKLQQLISGLGPIHEGAIEEYQALQERYQFLMIQYDDLVKAKDYLEKLIGDLDITMSEKFKEAFVKINEYFGEIFQKLFGGGLAKLALQDQDRILETGVEIIIQPPGKKQQNLSLFSGGERAFTVIALIFAFLKYRPAPFCVVDEIDAPLDEANVQRFSEFLQEYARHTQFIVVTHRKGTMEVADVMHGVTMEESGISKLISVKLMDQTG